MEGTGSTGEATLILVLHISANPRLKGYSDSQVQSGGAVTSPKA
jgi:hypothetical protein